MRSNKLPSIIATRQYANEILRLSSGTRFRASLRVGILGGSFNPAHRGHAAIAKNALEKLQLGRVVWVVARSSPFKEKPAAIAFKQRLNSAKITVANINKRANSVSNIEQRLNITYSQELANALTRAFPKVNLVFLMGADNFACINKWRAWQKLAATIPIAVFERKEKSLPARLGSAAKKLPRIKQSSHANASIVQAKTPRWAFISMRQVTISSTFLREGHR